jgi:TRAP-type mannitol/chloroaromatic compound transport system substrate-binding protein
MHVVGAGPFAKEAFVSTVPIRTVADLKGLKLRSPEGMAADVFRITGSAPTSIPFLELYTALEKKVLDAADASSYTNNSSLGFNKMAKYPLYPGIHSMAFIQFVINKAVWEKIGVNGQATLDTWYAAYWTDLTRATDVRDRELVAREHG